MRGSRRGSSRRGATVKGMKWAPGGLSRARGPVSDYIPGLPGGHE